MDRWDLVVKRDDLSAIEVRAASPLEPDDGEVLLAVEKFGLTTNNATYARFGESDIPFFDAFPGPEGYGRVPVWGFARVVESRHPEIGVGTRYFGYMPMSTHHVVRPAVTPRGFTDMTPTRHFLHPWYWTFELAAEPDGLDDRRALLHPVYPAAYNLADLLVAREAQGAVSAVITSASSKVAIGLVEELAHRGSKLTTVGITAATSFVEGLGLYDTVSPYDQWPPVKGPIVFVDLTGDAGTRLAVAETYEKDLAATVLIGFTHPTAAVPPPDGLRGPEAEVFFTPAVEWDKAETEGAQAYYSRYGASEKRFLESTVPWLTVRNGRGPEEIGKAYRSLLAGDQSPNIGHVLHP
ncbi:DUF2855 family protein [Planomonospora corallina]|uniref:DUF2855 family protein n=1 Tax=Planomonospora corallina TaxID=1806052 RepID=A0ABV8HZC1_9ACTN